MHNDQTQPLTLPLVSIVITSYNRGKFIGEAISSALSQEYQNIEVVISDNCSTDNTLDIIKPFESDNRVKFYRNHVNIGAIQNFRKSLYDLARGDLITFISSDDYLLDKHFISEAVSRFSSIRTLVIAKGRNFTFHQKSNLLVNDPSYLYWKKVYYNKDFVLGKEVLIGYPQCPSVGFGGSVYNREMLCRVGFGENGDKCLYADAESTLKLLSLGDASFIDLPTYVNRLHGNNATGNMNLHQFIANEIYISSVYDYMSKLKFLEDPCLDDWRDQMLIRYYSGILKFFRSQNSSSYPKLVAYLSESHESTWHAIKNSINWKIFHLISNNSLLLRIWSRLGRIKAGWVSGTYKRR